MRIAVKLNTVKARDRFLAVCKANGLIPELELADCTMPQSYVAGGYACVWTGIKEYSINRAGETWWVDKFMSINQLERCLRGK